jgi:membrane protease YdiL (CAAX protease family)
MINAAVEEGAYRGVVLQALDASLGRKVPALVGQAVAFGALHLQGFPRGWLGVGLACGYGWLMGDLRMRAGGLLASWLVHVLTDIVIVGVVIALTVSNP